MKEQPSLERQELPFVLREADMKDIKGILTVRRETWIDTYPNEELGITKQDLESIDYFEDTTINKWVDLLNKPEEHRKILVADHEGQIIGYLFIKQGKEQNKILGYYVLPDYQGKGVGTKLMEQALSWADPSKETYLEVVPYSQQAIRQYERFGFKKSGEEKTAIAPVALPNGKTLPSIAMIRPSEFIK